MDKVVTETWKKAEARKGAREYREAEEEIRCTEVREERQSEMQDFFQNENDEKYNILEKENDTDYSPDSPTTIPSVSNQNRLDLTNFVAEVDRYQISDRAAAALSTALLRDLGLVTDKDKSKVVDKYKVRRARKKRQQEKKRKRKEETSGQVTCLGFDGKKDKNTKVLMDILINERISTKQGVVTEEHVVFVNEPERRYMDNIVVDTGHGTGRDLGQAVCDLVRV